MLFDGLRNFCATLWQGTPPGKKVDFFWLENGFFLLPNLRATQIPKQRERCHSRGARL